MSRVLPKQGHLKGFWAGVIGSAALWAVQFEAQYALPPLLCKHEIRLLPHVISAAFLAAVAICALLSWHDYRHIGAGNFDEPDGGPIGRTRFLGMLGTLVSSMFFVLILAQAIASFFLNPCWT